MHVLIVNQYALPAGVPGITRHGDLGRELVRHGHQVTIVASRFNYLTRDDEQRHSSVDLHDGVRFRWLSTGRYRSNDRQRIRSMIDFTIRSTLIGMALRSRPDVVIGSSPHLLAGLSARLIARRFGAPFLFEVRDPWPSALVDLGAIRSGSRTHRALERLERYLYRSADRIITVMSHADRRVAEVGQDPTRCVHIPNAASLPDELAAIPTSLASVLDVESAAGREIVIYAGAHGVSNGLGDVLDALNQLRQSAPADYERLALVFIGDGPDRDALIARARAEHHEQVHFHPPIDKRALAAVFQRADFLLVHFARAAFKAYGMSANKLFDAMGAGRPVLVATPLADTPVDTAGAGMRYEPGSPEGLARTLSRAIGLPAAERRRMGERGREEVRQRYSLAATGAQLDQLIREVVART